MRFASVLLLAACGKPPDVVEIAVQPCRITNRDRTIDFQYDADGHLISRVERRDAITTSSTFTYDGDWLIEQRTATGTLGTAIWRYERDAAGNHVATTITNAGGARPPETTWRGEYDGKRLVRAYGAAGSMTNRTEYSHDERGRRTTETTRLGSAVVVTSYEYDDSLSCKRYGRPLDPPHTIARPPCPTVIRIADNERRVETRPHYRSGRLVDDGAYVYVHDGNGRLTRVHSIRVPASADVYEYDCR